MSTDIQEYKKVSNAILKLLTPVSHLRIQASTESYVQEDHQDGYVFVLVNPKEKTDAVNRLLEQYTRAEPDCVTFEYFAEHRVPMHSNRRLSVSDRRFQQAIKVALVQYDKDGQMRLRQLQMAEDEDKSIGIVQSLDENSWERVNHPIALVCKQNRRLVFRGTVCQHFASSPLRKNRQGFIVVKDLVMERRSLNE